MDADVAEITAEAALHVGARCGVEPLAAAAERFMDDRRRFGGSSARDGPAMDDGCIAGLLHPPVSAFLALAIGTG
jgi:hypothetical protein